ncbi:MAG: type II toxin-antitoxin system HicB family antitoxin [Hyphomonadaceae bacterium]|nr:type II toxin-antitoxin system HicB family antitoxin [Hyphomonadaceae bacterium]
MSLLEYKGYLGTAELSQADKVFHGKLAYIRDLVTYESDTAAGLMRAFKEAVDDYLSDCRNESREPDRPLKGQFNVRVRPELHHAYAKLAEERGVSLNEVVTEMLEAALEERR